MQPRFVDDYACVCHAFALAAVQWGHLSQVVCDLTTALGHDLIVLEAGPQLASTEQLYQGAKRINAKGRDTKVPNYPNAHNSAIAAISFSSVLQSEATPSAGEAAPAAAPAPASAPAAPATRVAVELGSFEEPSEDTAQQVQEAAQKLVKQCLARPLVGGGMRAWCAAARLVVQGRLPVAQGLRMEARFAFAAAGRVVGPVWRVLHGRPQGDTVRECAYVDLFLSRVCTLQVSVPCAWAALATSLDSLAQTSAPDRARSVLDLEAMLCSHAADATRPLLCERKAGCAVYTLQAVLLKITATLPRAHDVLLSALRAEVGRTTQTDTGTLDNATQRIAVGGPDRAQLSLWLDATERAQHDAEALVPLCDPRCVGRVRQHACMDCMNANAESSAKLSRSLARRLMPDAEGSISAR